jgi:hypothetical protein
MHQQNYVLRFVGQSLTAPSTFQQAVPLGDFTSKLNYSLLHTCCPVQSPVDRKGHYFGNKEVKARMLVLFLMKK